MSLIVNSNGALPMPNFMPPWPVGLAGCGCGCSGDCGVSGLTMDGTGLFGSGLFSEGFDVSTWGMGEYMLLGLAAYTLYALTSTTKAEFGRVRRGARKVKARFA